jgi:GntR family transcriptional regulator
MRARGMAPSARVLDREVIPAPAEVSAQLGLGLREAVIYLRRLRLADGGAMALEVNYLNYALCRPVLDAELEEGSLFTFLEQRAGIRICRASQEVEAVVSGVKDSTLLGLPRRHPVLVVRQVTYMRRGLEPEIPGIYDVSVYRADRYRFRMEVLR